MVCVTKWEKISIRYNTNDVICISIQVFQKNNLEHWKGVNMNVTIDLVKSNIIFILPLVTFFRIQLNGI